MTDRTTDRMTEEPTTLPALPAQTVSAEPSGSKRAAPARRATVRFMFEHPAHVLALGFGSGLSPLAPGTVGTLWAWVFYQVLRTRFDDVQFATLMAISLVVGWWACTVTARNLNQGDPGSIVWDEVIAFWLILWIVMPAGVWGQVIAFVLFRFFDTVKPGPVGWADRRFKLRPGGRIGWTQGFGILVDDLVAALCTLLVIALWRGWGPI
ncbi:phosphatidylglycerophosphatase A [soil metagenome]